MVTVLSAIRLPHYYWSTAFQEANQLKSRIELVQQAKSTAEIDPAAEKLSQKTIASWLAGTYGDHHPILGKCPEKDPWKNSYQCVARRVGNEERLGVYSYGRDGTSKSSGNDQDDLNSWNDDGPQWYKSVDSQRERTDTVVQGLAITFLIYVIFLFIKWAASAEKKQKGL